MLVIFFVNSIRFYQTDAMWQQLNWLEATETGLRSTIGDDWASSSSSSAKPGSPMGHSGTSGHTYIGALLQDKRVTYNIPSLEDLTRPTEASATSATCIGNDEAIMATVYNRNNTNERTEEVTKRYKIPFMIHQTAKSRCVIAEYNYTSNQWKNLEHYKYYFHDDRAVDELLYGQYYPEFPQLTAVAKNCLNSDAARIDLWRLLVLYLYGGIYADIDSMPTGFSHVTLREDDEAFFTVDKESLPSQYFMAVKPRHPFLYLALNMVLGRLLSQDDSLRYNPVAVTGPGVYRGVLSRFGSMGPNPTRRLLDKDWKVKPGQYMGLGDSKLRVVGTADKHENLVRCDRFPSKKDEAYRLMNMTHFVKQMRNRSGISCEEAIFRWQKRLREEADTQATTEGWA